MTLVDSSIESTRWRDLAQPTKREPAALGWDVAGEWVLARFKRRRPVRQLRERAAGVQRLAIELESLSENAYTQRIEDCRERVILGRDDPAVIDVALAVVRESIRRTVGIRLHTEQIMGGIVMAGGGASEMATGEGKTLTAILPAAIDGWMGRGVHVHTVNDYLAQRDAEITQAAYRRLGLSVCAIEDEMGPADRRNAYAQSVTYAAEKQFIFDHLRDRLVSPVAPRLAGYLLESMTERLGASWSNRVVQRGLHAAVVDEADSVLIDEAVTPAILSSISPDETVANEHALAAEIARSLSEDDHFTVDRRTRKVYLTDAGRESLAAASARLPSFWAGPRRREELVTTALTAQELFVKGDDYICDDKSVQLIDRSTGRILEGREWQHGLHQAVEAKEGLSPSATKEISARSSYQRFFQRYERLSGMSGTLWEVRDELWNWYRLPVERIPTHRQVLRVHAPDRVYSDEEAKFAAVADRVVEHHRSGRPVLVGTRSVLSSERLYERLRARGVECRVLNAEREAEEAEIVAEAGKIGAVTVATNMAGRGTDIKLEPEAKELGGLVVIATERHAERRVDRQLYGRSGRQGDPGLAETFTAFDDDLMTRAAPPILITLCKLTQDTAIKSFANKTTWSIAQRSASRAAVLSRNASAKQEAWYEMATHRATR